MAREFHDIITPSQIPFTEESYGLPTKILIKAAQYNEEVLRRKNHYSSTDHWGSARFGVNSHYYSKIAEAVFAQQFLGNPDLPNWSVFAGGDQGIDFEINNRTVDVKMSSNYQYPSICLRNKVYPSNFFVLIALDIPKGLAKPIGWMPTKLAFNREFYKKYGREEPPHIDSYQLSKNWDTLRLKLGLTL